MRPLLVALTLLGAGLSVLDYRTVDSGRTRGFELIETFGLAERYPTLRAEVRRRYDPVAAELHVARALLNDELDRSWLVELEAGNRDAELARSPERLAAAARIGIAAWPKRPTSWEAAMVQGGATYLTLYREKDPRLISEAELWELPLRASHELAPHQDGPVRFLAAAYLGNWSSLDSERRAAASELLRTGFANPKTYRLLIRDWLRVAPSRATALGLVPDEPWAWEALERIFAESADWELFVDARLKWYESLASHLDRSLDDLEKLVRGGDTRRARSRLLSLLQEIPRTLDFAPQLARLLELLPPGPVGEASGRLFGGWLEWAFEICLLNQCPVEPASLARLARLAHSPSSGQRALALLLSGDAPQAELLERRFAVAGGDDWNRYFLLKAERLAAAGKTADAVRSLAEIPHSERAARYWIAYERVTESEPPSAPTASRQWGAESWKQVEGSFRLSLLPDAEAQGLEIELLDAGRRSVVADVFFDGRLIGVRRSAARRTRLSVELPIEPGLHRLELRMHTGTARPGRVELRGERPG